jgi:hypothetical protein
MIHSFGTASQAQVDDLSDTENAAPIMALKAHQGPDSSLIVVPLSGKPKDC